MTKHWNWVGVAIFLYYVASLIYYIVVRATKTLNMGYLGYGVLVLLIEIVSSTATIGYAVLLVKYSKSRRTKGLPIAKKGQSPDLDNLAFHVRVLVPCYKESVELVKITVLGALKAPLPRNTLRTVYLCDDGRDPAKEEMIRELNAEYGCLEYVTGRKRDPNGEQKETADGREKRRAERRGEGRELQWRGWRRGKEDGSLLANQCRPLTRKHTYNYTQLQPSPTGETNGKSNNLNHCLQNVIYKDYFPMNANGPKIPKQEVMVVFDADMVAKPNFFTKVCCALAWLDLTGTNSKQPAAAAAAACSSSSSSSQQQRRWRRGRAARENKAAAAALRARGARTLCSSSSSSSRCQHPTLLFLPTFAPITHTIKTHQNNHLQLQ